MLDVNKLELSSKCVCDAFIKTFILRRLSLEEFKELHVTFLFDYQPEMPQSIQQLDFDYSYDLHTVHV